MTELRAVQATPHVFPFPECQGAAPHDLLRCLAEVPALAAALAKAG